MIALSQFNSLSKDEARAAGPLRGDPGLGRDAGELTTFRQPPCAAAGRP